VLELGRIIGIMEDIEGGLMDLYNLAAFERMVIDRIRIGERLVQELLEHGDTAAWGQQAANEELRNILERLRKYRNGGIPSKTVEPIRDNLPHKRKLRMLK